MIVKWRVEFDDESRADIAAYRVQRFGEKPRKLASREQLLNFLQEALNNQMLYVADDSDPRDGGT